LRACDSPANDSNTFFSVLVPLMLFTISLLWEQGLASVAAQTRVRLPRL
jgi:hypothetical protein